MLKYLILFFIANVLVINIAKCQTSSDTTITYFKTYSSDRFYKVSTLDSADFIRMVLPPDPGDNKKNVREYYKSGQLKMMGKYEPHDNLVNYESLTGTCITYFSTGKRKSVIQYADFQKNGDEYLYYPNGTIYCHKKNFFQKGFQKGSGSKTLYLECYDNRGLKISNDGNGKWIIYDDDFNIILQGPVKDGLLEGDWNGSTNQVDSIKYTYKYSKGLFVSGIGYDKTGTAYPFQDDVEAPAYQNHDLITFVQIFRSHLTLPPGLNPKKAVADTAHISFIIEKNGSLSHPELSCDTSQAVKDAIQIALNKSSGWRSRRYYGIPVRSRFTISFKVFGKGEDNYYTRKVEYREQILGF